MALLEDRREPDPRLRPALIQRLLDSLVARVMLSFRVPERHRCSLPGWGR
jgi:hypothetical protein